MSSSDTLSESDSALLRIDEACTQFEVDWTPETAAQLVANAVDQFEPIKSRALLLRELIATDCELRSRAGQEITPEQFADALPECAAEIDAALELWKQTEFSSEQAGSSSLPDEMPEKIGDYQIVRELGRGGTSIVYEAIQPDLNRRVALKVRLLHPLRFAEQRQRFELEARAAGQLQHENIVAVFDSGEDSGVLFYAMQFVDGYSLSQLIRVQRELNSEESPLDETDAPADAPREHVSQERAAQLIAQAASALEYAHHNGVLHRDVKPSNLLLDQSGTLRLADFGLAKIVDSDDDLTQSGDVVGSLRYLPPEAFQGIRDERSDVYGLGLTLYELLIHQPAFGGKDRSQLMHSICEDDVRSPRQIDDSIPLDLDTITMKAIARDPGDRYSLAREFGDDLQRFLAGKPIHARPVSLPERIQKWAARNPLLATLSALVMAFVFIGLPAYYLMWQGRELDQLRAGQELSEAALRHEKSANAALEASAVADQAQARAAGAADAHADAEYALLINGAQRAIDAGDYSFVVQRMSQYEQRLQEARASGAPMKDRRDWEWSYLKQRCDQAVVTIPPEKGTEFRALRLSPDEGSFVSVGQRMRSDKFVGGTVRMRDTSTGDLIRTFADSEEIFCDAAFSPDGTKLSTISFHDTTMQLVGWVRMWEVASGKLLRSHQLVDDFPIELYRPGSIKKVLPQVQFSQDGKLLVTSSPVITFDAETLEPIWQREGGRVAILTESIAIIGERTTELHDLQTGTPLTDKPQRCFLPIDFDAKSGNSECLMVNRSGKELAFHRIDETGLPQSTKILIPQSFWTAFTIDGEHIVRSELKGDIVIQEPVEGGQEIHRLVGHQSPVVSGAFHSNGDRLVTADRSGVVKIWEVGQSDNRVTIDVNERKQASVEAIAFAPTGDRLHHASCNFYEKGGPKAGWVRSDGSSQETFEIETTSYIFWPRHDISYNHDGSLLAAPAKEEQRPETNGELVGRATSGRIHVWSTETNEILRSIDLEKDDRITAIAWRADRKMLAVATATDSGQPVADIGLVPVDNPSEQSIQWLPAGEGMITCLAFTPDGTQLATAYFGGKAALISTENVGQVDDLRNGDEPGRFSSCIDVDPTGTYLAVATAGDPIVRIFAVASRKLIHTVSLSQYTCSLRFSPNGRRLAIVNQQSIVHLIAVSSGHSLLTLDGRSDMRHPSPGTSIKVVFSADGRRIATPGLAGRITIWEAGAE